MIHIKYKIWFAIKLEVEDFRGELFDLCALVPSDRCLQNLDRERILVRQQPNMLTHLIEVNADGPDVDKPIHTPDETVAFRYQLLSKAGGLQTHTNIDTTDPAHYILYLSNNVNNVAGSILYTNHSGTAAGNADRLFRGMFEDVQAASLAVIDVFQNNLVTAAYRLLD